MHPREEQPVDRSHVTVATQHRTAEHSRTTAGQLQRDPQATVLLLSCSQACPTIVASPTNAHVHQGVAQHINLILECADASIDNTLADPPDCPKAPCPSFSSMNDGLTASPLACLSRNQQSSNVLSSHRGAHGHTRDLMTSLGPCKSKTADPTCLPRGPWGEKSFGAGATPKCSPPHRANCYRPQARGLPKAVVQKGATASELRKTSCPTQLTSLVGLSAKGSAGGRLQTSI